MKDFTTLQNHKIKWCHWDIARFLDASHLTDDIVIGMMDNSYLKKEIFGDSTISDLEIYIYKEDDKYKIQIFNCETNEYDILEFDNAETALENFDMIPYNHPIYKTRRKRYVNTTTNEILDLDKIYNEWCKTRKVEDNKDGNKC